MPDTYFYKHNSPVSTILLHSQAAFIDYSQSIWKLKTSLNPLKTLNYFAKATPQAIAIVNEKRSITYEQLNILALFIAIGFPANCKLRIDGKTFLSYTIL